MQHATTLSDPTRNKRVIAFQDMFRRLMRAERAKKQEKNMIFNQIELKEQAKEMQTFLNFFFCSRIAEFFFRSAMNHQTHQTFSFEHAIKY